MPIGPPASAAAGKRCAYDHNGNFGLIALDNSFGPSIRFCQVGELDGYPVNPSGRYITKLHVDAPVRIGCWNRRIDELREQSQDVPLACYKGIRKDGRYRRQLDWQAACCVGYCP